MALDQPFVRLGVFADVGRNTNPQAAHYASVLAVDTKCRTGRITLAAFDVQKQRAMIQRRRAGVGRSAWRNGLRFDP